jgi:anthranilate phosphoribosyltransferase
LGKETQPEYIAAVAEAMRNASLPISSTCQVVDIVGTGGDGKNTFNVSTASSIVVAGAGCKVAKVFIFVDVAWKQSFFFYLWFS